MIVEGLDNLSQIDEEAALSEFGARILSLSDLFRLPERVMVSGVAITELRIH